MTFDPEKHHRHSIRLKNYDYSQPGFFFDYLYLPTTILVWGNQK